MTNYQANFIEFMVRSGVLTFGDFVTKSGRKTPFFINTGNYKTGEQMAKLGEFYAECIKANAGSFEALYGPAYKGIPLSVTTAVALYQKHNINIAFCFNRKEAKDHGEGGTIIGYKPVSGDRVVIIEDVITAGTSVRESVPLLKSLGNITVSALIVSVDRMERGQGTKSALKEVEEEFGIMTFSIVNIREIVEHLHNRTLDGKVLIDDLMKERIEAYIAQYGALN